MARKNWGEICLSASRIEFEARGGKIGLEGGEREREENVFEVVSRAVARKRRGVSRRWPNITQRSLFRAGGEAGAARNRNDLEQRRAGPPPCSNRTVPSSLVPFSTFHHFVSRPISRFRAPTRSRPDGSRDSFITGALVDRHPARLCHLFSPPFLTKRPGEPGSCLVNRRAWEPTRAVRLSRVAFHFFFSLVFVDRMGKYIYDFSRNDQYPFFFSRIARFKLLSNSLYLGS